MNMKFQLRIRWYKRKNRTLEPSANDPRFIFIHKLFVLDIERHSVSKLLTNAACILMLTFEAVLGVIHNQVPWKDIDHYPHVLILYFFMLISPTTSSLSIAFAYMMNHKEFCKTIWRELKERIHMN